jgi:hypothetical protein
LWNVDFQWKNFKCTASAKGKLNTNSNEKGSSNSYLQIIHQKIMS